MGIKHATASTLLFRRAGVVGGGGAGVVGGVRRAPGALGTPGVRRTPGDGWEIGLMRHPLFGKLMLPGGHVEIEETAAQAALREVAEETGLTARFVPAPRPPLPPDLNLPVVEQPWWILEQPVPSDNHLAAPHVHVDHLYVAVAGDRCGTAAHPLNWHAGAELDRLDMFEDTRMLAGWLLQRIGDMAAFRLMS